MLKPMMLINGELIGSGALDVVNPATGEVFLQVPAANEELAQKAIAAAKSAFASWRKTDLEIRRELLTKFADTIESYAEEIAQMLVKEQGKPIADARLEPAYGVAFIRHFASIEFPEQIVQDDDTHKITVHRKPLGVVVGITPWNFPFLMACYKIAPALYTGNTMVLKPSPTTPVTTLMLSSILQSIFPAGVVNIIADHNDLGEFLTSHPDVSKVSFTGSIATGRKVMQSGAATLKRLTLELGGNDAAILLDDIDIESTVPKVFEAAFFNNGQVCIAPKRIYVHRKIYDQVVDKFAQIADSTVVGEGTEEGVQLGPVQNKQQYEKIKHYVEIAKRDGKVVAGGVPLEGRKGFFMRPTIVRDISDDSPLVKEEQFGPVLPVIAYDDITDVIEKANALEFGLGGSIWSSDVNRAVNLGQNIESGTVWINQHLHFGPHIPFAGAKQSGVGVEFADEGLKEYTQIFVVNIAK